MLSIRNLSQIRDLEKGNMLTLFDAGLKGVVLNLGTEGLVEVVEALAILTLVQVVIFVF